MVAVPPPALITATSIYSLLGTIALLLVALLAARRILPRTATGPSKTEYLTCIWILWDLLIHIVFEGSFLWQSFPPPRTVNSSSGMFAELWQEYAIADARWGTADSTIVSIELLTVFGCSLLCLMILRLMSKGDLAYHYWLVVLSTAEIYGGWMTFVPEILDGSHALRTDHFLYKWVYLIFFNGLWVVVPAALLVISYKDIALAVRRGGLSHGAGINRAKKLK